jgi:hypothetical protein
MPTPPVPLGWEYPPPGVEPPSEESAPPEVAPDDGGVDVEWVEYVSPSAGECELRAMELTDRLGNRRADALADMFCPSGGLGLGKPFDAVRPRLLVVARAEALLGADHFPAELVGYGTIPAAMARAIAADATWQALYADGNTGRVVAAGSKLLPPGVTAPGITGGQPESGAELPVLPLVGGWVGECVGLQPESGPELPVLPPGADPPDGDRPSSPGRDGSPEGAALPPEAWPSESLGSHSYRPSGRLQATVVLRDQQCVFPNCQRPAWSCDLDHVQPFDPSRPAIDQTVASNLVPACRAHHRLKTLAGWDWTRDVTTGVLTVTSPHGRIYRMAPPTPTSPPWVASGW